MRCANAPSIIGDQNHGKTVRCQNDQSAPALVGPLRIGLMPRLICRLNSTGTVNLPELADCRHRECLSQAPAVFRHVRWMVTDMIPQIQRIPRRLAHATATSTDSYRHTLDANIGRQQWQVSTQAGSSSARHCNSSVKSSGIGAENVRRSPDAGWINASSCACNACRVNPARAANNCWLAPAGRVARPP